MNPARENREASAMQHLRFSGSMLPVGASLSAFLLIGLGFATTHHLSTVVGLYCALLTIVGLELRSRLKRAIAGDENLDLTTHCLGSAIVAWMLTTLAVGFAYWPIENVPGYLGAWTAIVGLVLAVVLLWALKTYYSRQQHNPWLCAQDVVPWLNMGLSLASLSVLGIISVELGLIERDTYLVRFSMLLAALPAIEWTLQALKRRNGFPPLIGGSTTISAFFGGSNPVDIMFDVAHDKIGIDLHSTWALSVLRRSVMPVLLGTISLAWLSTSIVAIDVYDKGIVERFGASRKVPPLSSGLHLKAPWPIDLVHRINVSEIHTVSLGFAGVKEGASLLWTKRHADEEYSLLLGDGRDLITVNAVLNYRISSAREWHYTTQNPHERLHAIAEQVLLRNTVGKSLEEVLSENMAAFAGHIQNDIQSRLDASSLGASILSLSLLGLHPPVEVAREYQTVVSAQHERESLIFDAETYKVERLNEAKRQALAFQKDAERAAVNRLAEARGDAEVFSRKARSYASTPDLYIFRRRLDALDEQLSSQHINIIDNRIIDEGGELWLLD